MAEHFGGLDVLVNNAGAGPSTPPDTLTEAEWDEVVETKLKGSFFAAQHAVQLMRRRRREDAGPDGVRGRIINVASVPGVVGHPSPDTLVNAVAPGYIDSPLNAYGRAIPRWRRRSWTPRRCAAGAAWRTWPWPCGFLASAAAGFIAGSTLMVDGNLSIA